MVLSEAGRELVEPARQVLRDLETARSVAQSVKDLRRGRLDLVSMPSPGIEPLTTIMCRFAEEHPGVMLNVDGAFTAEEVVSTVRTGVAEIGLLGAAGDLHTAELKVMPIGDQPLVLISPPGCDLPEGTVGQGDMRGLRMIASQRGSLMRRFVDDLLEQGAGVQLAAEIAHRTSILPLVLSGFGHAVMPSAWTPLAERAGASVRRIEPAWRLRMSLVSRPQGLTPAARTFLRIASEWTAE